jgi:hypothetical protein
MREVASLEIIDPKRGYWVQALDDVMLTLDN